jgi:signal transduction histidine kinase
MVDGTMSKVEQQHRRKVRTLSTSEMTTERRRLWQIFDSLHDVGVSLAHLSQKANLSDVLQSIAQKAVDLLGSDLVTLYQYDQSQHLFLVEGTGPTIAGQLFVSEPMRTRVYPDTVTAMIIKDGVSRYFLDVKREEFLIGKTPARDDLPERPRFAVREGIKSMAALVLRAGEEIVGIMFANYRKLHRFSEDEKRILETFGNYAAVAIKNARLLDKLQQLQDQRLAAERWGTLGKAAATLAHRINNTAALVPFAVQDLKELIAQLPMDGRHQEHIEGDLRRIETNVRYTLELATVLLKPFKSATPERLDINRLLEKAIAICALPEIVKVDITYDQKLPPITSSPLLVDVFVELILNSIKAMPQGGQLKIGSLLASPNLVKIWLADTGVGIPTEHQEKVFDLFFTTGQENLGFGLWWVKTFILQQGGSISLDSHPGRGSTFTIHLPIYPMV